MLWPITLLTSDFPSEFYFWNFPGFCHEELSQEPELGPLDFPFVYTSDFLIRYSSPTSWCLMLANTRGEKL